MKRNGFTLVEILVVIAIMAVLVAITSVVLQKTTAINKLKVTETTIFKLQKVATTERRAVIARCEKDAQDRRIPNAVTAFCDGNSGRARAVWTAAKLRQYFPLTFADATTPIVFSNPVDSSDIFVLRPLAIFGEVSGATPPTIDSEATNELHESGAILFLALTKKDNPSDDVTSTERMVLTFGAKELHTFKDGWGRPIGFKMNFTQTPGTDQYMDNWNLSPTDPRRRIMSALSPYNPTRLLSVQSKGENITRGGLTDDVLGELLYYRRK